MCAGVSMCVCNLIKSFGFVIWGRVQSSSFALDLRLRKWEIVYDWISVWNIM